MDHPRERFRTGWKPAAHAVFLRGVPYLIRLPEDCPESARLVREPFAVSREFPGILLLVGSYIFVKSILDAHVREMLLSSQDLS